MDKQLFSTLFNFQKKSKIKAGDGLILGDGNYPFYTSSDTLTKSLNDYLFEEESLIFGTGGKASVHYCNSKFAVSTDCFVCQPKSKADTFAKYVFYYLSGNIHLLEEGFKGAGLKHISKDYLSNLKIPLPSLDTQKKIAAILDAADKLRQLDKKLIEKYDALTQSLFLDMFGDPVSNPKSWKKIPMSNLMKIVRGGSPRPIDNYLGGTYPWIKIGDATKGNDIYLENTKEHIIEAGLKKTRLLPKGSLIFANCGVSLGFARILTFEGCIHDGWLAFSEIDNKKLNEILLLKALNSITRYFRETATDGTQPNLNIAIMSKFEIILPPVELQNKFEKGLFEIEAQKTQAQQSLQKSEELFNSLLQKAFKGELVQ